MLRRVDLHLHTKHSAWKHLKVINPRDSYSEPLAAYEACKAAGMDFVALTDHDNINGALDLLSSHPELEPEVIIGEEVETIFPETGQWVHVNVFGINEAVHDDITRLRPNIRELVAYLRRNGIFHVLNHPFQSYRKQKPGRQYADDILELFDHFEVSNCTLPASHNSVVAELLEHANALVTTKHGIGASDAHDLRDVARSHTEVEVEGTTKEDLLAALAAGAGHPAGRSIGPLQLTGNIYRIIGRYYASFFDPEIRREMTVMNHLGAAMLAPACALGVPVLITLGNSIRLEITSAYMRRCLREGRVTAAQVAPALGSDRETAALGE